MVDDASNKPIEASRKQASIVPADGRRSAQSGWRLPSQKRGSSEDHIRCDGFFALGVCRAVLGSRFCRSGFPRKVWRARARSTARADAGVRGRCIGGPSAVPPGDGRSGSLMASRGCVASDEGEAARVGSGSRKGDEDDCKEGWSSTAPSTLIWSGIV